MTPGSVGNLLNFAAPFDKGTLIDRTHPAANFNRKEIGTILPQAYSNAFTLRAVPQAILSVPESLFPDPPFKYAPEVRTPGRINISLTKVIGKKSVHKSACVRRRIASRFKNAMSLIITRGADVHVDKKGRSSLIFRDEDIGEKWVLSGWTYMVIPTLKVLRMPYPDLVKSLRMCLERIKRKGDELEALWTKVGHKSPSKIRTGPRPRSNNANVAGMYQKKALSVADRVAPIMSTEGRSTDYQRPISGYNPLLDVLRKSSTHRRIDHDVRKSSLEGVVESLGQPSDSPFSQPIGAHNQSENQALDAEQGASSTDPPTRSPTEVTHQRPTVASAWNVILRDTPQPIVNEQKLNAVSVEQSNRNPPFPIQRTGSRCSEECGTTDVPTGVNSGASLGEDKSNDLWTTAAPPAQRAASFTEVDRRSSNTSSIGARLFRSKPVITPTKRPSHKGK